MSPPSSDTYTRVVLATRPTGDITPSTFRTERHSLSSLSSSLPPRHVLLRVAWLSLDPAMRGWLNDVRSYIPPVGIGETMRATGLGVIIQVGEESAFKVGEVVHGVFGKPQLRLLTRSC
jgi:NADPH-dependent curcumin reductase CurA